MIKMIQINSKKLNDESQRWQSLHIAYDNYLSQKYPKYLALVCDELTKAADKQPNRDMALAKAIEAFFDKKSYDFSYYNKSTNTRADGTHFAEHIGVYKEYKYINNG